MAHSDIIMAHIIMAHSDIITASLRYHYDSPSKSLQQPSDISKIPVHEFLLPVPADGKFPA